MFLRQLAERIYQVPFLRGFVNCYLIDTDDGLLLIDTAMSAANMDRLLAALPEIGRQPQDLRHIFITHAHVDHVGGLRYLQSVVNAQTYAHQREAGIISGEKAPVYPPPAALKGMARVMRTIMNGSMSRPLPVARVDTTVQDGDTLLEAFQALYLPGHTYGQVGLWWPERRLLVGGDVMTRFRGLGLPLAPATPDMPMAKESIQRVADMGVESLLLGHGAPIMQGADAEIQRLVARL